MTYNEAREEARLILDSVEIMSTGSTDAIEFLIVKLEEARTAARADGAAEQRAKDAEIVRRLRDAARSVLCTEEAECLDEAAEIIELG